MLNKCSFGPFKIPKLAINVSDPHVKLNANFCGLMASTGTPTKKARAKNNAERRSKAQNTYRKRVKMI
jgi:hypothetical protein